MLVLSRKLDESFIIDGNIEVIVTAIQGNKVSLGISAPEEVKIFRKELCLGHDEKMQPKIKSSSNASMIKRNWDILSGVQTLR
ncbi:MAG: carbon storage regulator [Thermoguttaceae bacterium]|nr:carbon storage regulator [Thermoguttaceae bacterium]MDO4856734.1 carbon storage regulator [Thermoguttaceae bacterium]